MEAQDRIPVTKKDAVLKKLKKMKPKLSNFTGFVTGLCYNEYRKTKHPPRFRKGGARMANKAWGEEYRTTIVCVDSYENQIPCGRFYNPHLSEGRMFQSATGFLLKMEQTLDAMEFPKAFTATRSFSTPPKPAEDFPEPGTLTGEKATFAVRILFRQNASWQGSITWLEGRQEQSFRSVLELLLLMDSALTTEQPA